MSDSKALAETCYAEAVRTYWHRQSNGVSGDKNAMITGMREVFLVSVAAMKQHNMTRFVLYGGSPPVYITEVDVSQHIQPLDSATLAIVSSCLMGPQE